MINFLFINTPLKYLVESFWRDEAFSYILATKNIFDIIVLSFKDFNPPLYYLILHFWMKITGNSEIALRLLSLIFFWLTLYVCFLFLVNILKINVKKSSLYLLFFLINPILNYYAFETRMYSLFTFLSALSFYLFYKKSYRWYILVSILGLYTHYFMVFVIISQAIFVIIERQHLHIKPILKSFFLISLSFTPAIIVIIFQKQFENPFWIEKPGFLSLFTIPFTLYTGYESGFAFYQNTLLFTFLVILFILLILSPIIFNLLHKRLGNKNIFFFLLLWTFLGPFLVFLISFYKPILYPRYLIFATPGMLLLLIYLFEKLHFKFKNSIFIILLIFTLSYNYLQIKYKDKADIKKTLTEIKTMANKNDLIYVRSELDFHTGEYYFGKNKVYIYGKDYAEIPAYVGKVLIPKDKITNRLPIFPQKAFIINTDLSYDIQSEY